MRYDSNNDPIKIVDLAYPFRGTPYVSTDPAAIVLEYPGNVVAYEFPEDGATAANAMYGVGPGSNEGKLIASAFIPSQLAAGWPLLEDTTTYNDVYDPNLLANLTAAEVLAKKEPIATVKVVLPAYVDPVLGTYKTGDEVLLRITDVRFPPNGPGFGLSVVKRIVSINVEPGEDGPERVTLVLTDPTQI